MIFSHFVADAYSIHYPNSLSYPTIYMKGAHSRRWPHESTFNHELIWWAEKLLLSVYNVWWLHVHSREENCSYVRTRVQTYIETSFIALYMGAETNLFVNNISRTAVEWTGINFLLVEVFSKQGRCDFLHIINVRYSVSLSRVLLCLIHTSCV